MAWAECRDQLVSIVEGTTPTLTKRGLPGSFKHVVNASADGFTPSARAFWFTIDNMLMKGQVTLTLPRWFRYSIALNVVYPVDVDPTLMFEAIASDHAALAARLPDVSLWGQATSTLEGLFLGADEILAANIDVTDEGVAIVTYPMTAEFRQT